MEIIVNTESLSYVKLLPKPLSPALVFPSRANVLSHNFNCLPRKLQCGAKQLRNLGAIYASGADSSSTNVVEKWILEPIGDGDTKHLGVKIAMPNAFEIASSVITIGRTADKVDVAIPVPTVSAVHARIEKAEKSLVITDLDSTNGTFIDQRRLKPGVPAFAVPGSRITFGDVHLAVFRVSKLEVEEPSNEPEAEAKVEEGADSN
ncbi:zeaxanthin epoxidase, chloroplastic-like [Coffea arabica]|uniref:Zeaxanthin epoxidase, chloroplastic-like n=1 Tax=Coffea arabica TaxID=13443 RepID=A0A6P6TS57_COFAR|nr:uncharacterized protein LOC113703942 [Coffea arabica]